LDEAEATISEGVREMACRLNQDSASFEKTAANLARAAHWSISKEALRQLIEGEGKVVLRALQRGELQPEWTAEECGTAEGVSRLYLGSQQPVRRGARTFDAGPARRRGHGRGGLPPAKADGERMKAEGGSFLRGSA
jgi:hypothetical protein